MIFYHFLVTCPNFHYFQFLWQDDHEKSKEELEQLFGKSEELLLVIQVLSYYKA